MVDRPGPRDFIKRLLDLTVAILALPVALPIVAIAGILIRRESSGDIFFRQVRVGQNQRPFRVFKLRTMVPGAEQKGAGIYLEANDPRITPLGSWLRRLSIDEIPQLFNVLSGEMSLVGPRPMLPVTVAEYPQEYATILEVKPGLTGLVQVSGRNLLSRRERIALDLRYVRERCLWLDLQILARTVGVVLGMKGQRNKGTRADVEGPQA